MTKHESGTGPGHFPGQRKGEEMVKGRGKEPGRKRTGRSGANRPHGMSTARDSTSINPDLEEPILPEMPHMPPA
jgi:hypothetical protein